jgi:hypothetical protein
VPTAAERRNRGTSQCRPRYLGGRSGSRVASPSVRTYAADTAAHMLRRAEAREDAANPKESSTSPPQKCSCAGERKRGKVQHFSMNPAFRGHSSAHAPANGNAGKHNYPKESSIPRPKQCSCAGERNAGKRSKPWGIQNSAATAALMQRGEGTRENAGKTQGIQDSAPTSALMPRGAEIQENAAEQWARADGRPPDVLQREAGGPFCSRGLWSSGCRRNTSAH